MDLTISSDAETEQRFEDEGLDDISPTIFKRYDLSDDEDDEYVDRDLGWVQNEEKAVRKVEHRRYSSTDLRSISQTSLNTQPGRKTTAK